MVASCAVLAVNFLERICVRIRPNSSKQNKMKNTSIFDQTGWHRSGLRHQPSSWWTAAWTHWHYSTQKRRSCENWKHSCGWKRDFERSQNFAPWRIHVRWCFLIHLYSWLNDNHLMGPVYNRCARLCNDHSLSLCGKFFPLAHVSQCKTLVSR